ncbi:MAG: Uma2 family endonuclease [Deltaproteobacteria bacterium]|nr:Uma2 family endonuclease [Deltaproteobacteria bacterium]
MSSPARRRATYQDLLGVPPHWVAELIDGEVVTSPRPAFRHARASSIIGGSLVGPYDLGTGGPGGWWILDEPELHFGENVLVPDLAGWRRERMPVFPDVPFCEVAPDWVCEVLSPATAGLDRVRKLPIYARAGVAHAWLIDPAARTLEVLRLQAGSWVVVAAFGEDQTVRVEPFGEVGIPLATLWIGEGP